MGKFIDLTGQTFGRLKVIQLAFSKNKRLHWKCICNCGTEKNIIGNLLRNGNTKSCGCLSRELTIKASTTHGMCGTATYKCWQNMLSRCYNPNVDAYKFYGGRGIIVCSRWRKKNGFINFYKDMGKKPVSLTLDRLDSNGNYNKLNCHWGTNEEQSNNRRSNTPVEFRGEIKNLCQWAKLFNINKATLCTRLSKGWPFEKALTTPINNPKNCIWLEYNGQKKNMSEWAKIKNISAGTLCIRLKKGWTIKKALETPVKNYANR